MSDKVKTYWYQNDHLGTPHSLGEVVYSCSYNAYGKVIEEEHHQQEERGIRVDNPLRFQGLYWDEETGLHYNLNRYYDPGVERYITQDPVKLLAGSNFYRYCTNPTIWIDPLGLMPGLGASNDMHPVSGGGLRNGAPLTEAQKVEAIRYAESLGGPWGSIYVCDNMNTSYGMMFGEDALLYCAG